MTNAIEGSRGQALAALERALREPPDLTGQELEHATLRIVCLRDALIAYGREASNKTELFSLDQINAVLSLVVGAQYPMLGLHRERIQSARDTLASVSVVAHANSH